MRENNKKIHKKYQQNSDLRANDVDRDRERDIPETKFKRREVS